MEEKETHTMHKGFIHTSWLEMRDEIDNGCNCKLSWTTTKVNVSIDNINEREGKGRDLYFHKYVLAMVLARRIPSLQEQFFSIIDFLPQDCKEQQHPVPVQQQRFFFPELKPFLLVGGAKRRLGAPERRLFNYSTFFFSFKTFWQNFENKFSEDFLVASLELLSNQSRFD